MPWVKNDFLRPLLSKHHSVFVAPLSAIKVKAGMNELKLLLKNKKQKERLFQNHYFAANTK